MKKTIVSFFLLFGAIGLFAQETNLKKLQFVAEGDAQFNKSSMCEFMVGPTYRVHDFASLGVLAGISGLDTDSETENVISVPILLRGQFQNNNKKRSLMGMLDLGYDINTKYSDYNSVRTSVLVGYSEIGKWYCGLGWTMFMSTNKDVEDKGTHALTLRVGYVF